jgi:DNA-binding XRE family transcriptional regulator
MVDRIKKIMEYYKYSPASFSERIGINRSNLTHLFSGRNQPSLELAKKILHYFPDIKTEWLIMGVGDMFRDNDEKELTIKIQNEKKLQFDQNEPDLFTNTAKEQINVTARESDIENRNSIALGIFDSKHDTTNADQTDNSTNYHKKETIQNIANPDANESALPPYSTSEVSKIVFFYTDGRFEMFHGKE